MALILVEGTARAESTGSKPVSFNLAAEYQGGAAVGYLYSYTVASYGAWGTNSAAPYGLNSVAISIEGFYNQFDETISQSDPGHICLLTDLGDGFEGTSWIPGEWSFWGTGSVRALRGNYAAHGTGRFQGQEIEGSFYVPTGEQTGWPFRGPATVSIRGTATSPIPEPSTLALLALASTGLLFRRRLPERRA